MALLWFRVLVEECYPIYLSSSKRCGRRKLEILGIPLLEILPYAAFGFVAQMVDGCLGMAYGVCSNTLLLSSGLPPAAASATVHASELFTTAASGLSHLKYGNVDRGLVLRLLPAGVAGGALGAYVLTSFPGEALKPFIAGYLALMGVVILVRAFRPVENGAPAASPRLVPLGLAGGFLDAVGGGGWGPVVTTSLVAGGNTPRYVIGSVNLAEFFVTLAESAVFLMTVGIQKTSAILGLLCGGILAAPLAAWACGRVPRKPMMAMVGLLVIAVSVRTLYRAVA